MLRELSTARIAAAVAIAGLSILIFLELSTTAERMSIAEAINAAEGKIVIVRGVIENTSATEHNIYFSLNDGKTITVILRNPTAEQINLIRKNSFVEVKGRISKFRERKIIYAEKVLPWMD